MRWLIRIAFGPRRRRSPRRPDSRYPLFALYLLLAGCLIVSTSSAFPHRVAATIGFGMSIPAVIAALAVLVIARRQGKYAFVAISAVVSTLATWTIVATAWTFGAAAARWISFGSALGYMLCGVVTLVLHEASPERVVHLIEVRQLPARS